MADAPATPPVLTADQLLKGRGRRIEYVEIPELGGGVYVREMTGLERDRFDDSLVDDKGNFVADNARARVVVACACDAQGNRVFSDAQLAAVGNMPNGVLDPIYEEASKLNRLRPRDRVAEKKDSGGTTDAASPSGSPSPSGGPTPTGS